MGLSLNYIKRNRGVYLSTLVIFIILSYIILFSKYWSNSYLSLSSEYSNFLSSQSIAIEKNSSSGRSVIDLSTTEEIDKILGEYDSAIKGVSYRLELSGIVKNGDRESQFQGIGVDLKRDEEFIDKYIEISNGDSISLKSQNAILISKTLSEKIEVEQNQSIELYVLNRDGEKMDYEVINSASLKVSGLFEERFENRELIILPIRLAESILKTSEINMIVVDFYLTEDRVRYENELEEKLNKFGFSIKKIENNLEREKIDFGITTLYIFIILFVVVLAYRDVSILIERRRDDIRTLINYGWKDSQISLLNIKEATLFHLITYFIVVGVVFALLKLTAGGVINSDMIEIDFMDIAPIFVGSLIIHAVWYLFLAKFER